MSTRSSAGLKHTLAGLVSRMCCLMVGVCVAASPSPSFSQCAEDQRLETPEGEGGMGISASVNGDRAALGRYRADCAAGDDCGAANVFHFNGTTWTTEQILTASDEAEDDRFGGSVSINGETIFVGAASRDCSAGLNCGSVYVFGYDGTQWVERQILAAPDAADGDGFGASVSIVGDTALVGATGDDCIEGSGCGAVYVFRFDGSIWVEQHKFVAMDADGGLFGTSVSLGDNVALVGADQAFDAQGSDRTGAAYVFHNDGIAWTQVAKLTASDGEEWDKFGTSVSLADDWALIGANYDHHPGAFRGGSAYLFRYDGTDWVEEVKLTAPEPVNRGYFGVSVSLSGNVAVIGSPRDRVEFEPLGSAYVFRYDGSGWAQEQKLIAAQLQANDYFGRSVSVSGESAIVAAIGNGAAYAFDLGVNLVDYSCFLDCVTEPGGQLGTGCAYLDYDGDEDVDFVDLGRLQIAFGQ